MRALMVVLLLVFFICPANAREIAGVSLSETVTVNEKLSLQLNGAGIRYKIFFKVYIAQLYMQHPSKDAQKVIEDVGHKRVVMHFLYDGVSKEKIVAAWNKGFEENLSEGEYATLKEKIILFNAMFVEMKKGEEIILDYTPKKGTEVRIKGQSMGLIEGKAFNDALLSIWIGDIPASSDLKEELLAYTQ